MSLFATLNPALHVDPLALVPVLLVGAGLLGIDLPYWRGPQ